MSLRIQVFIFITIASSACGLISPKSGLPLGCNRSEYNSHQERLQDNLSLESRLATFKERKPVEIGESVLTGEIVGISLMTSAGAYGSATSFYSPAKQMTRVSSRSDLRDQCFQGLRIVDLYFNKNESTVLSDALNKTKRIDQQLPGCVEEFPFRGSDVIFIYFKDATFARYIPYTEDACKSVEEEKIAVISNDFFERESELRAGVSERTPNL